MTRLPRGFKRREILRLGIGVASLAAVLHGAGPVSALAQAKIGDQGIGKSEGKGGSSSGTKEDTSSTKTGIRPGSSGVKEDTSPTKTGIRPGSSGVKEDTSPTKTGIRPGSSGTREDKQP